MIESEHSLGDLEETKKAINIVLKNGNTKNDRRLAYVHEVICKAEETRDYSLAVEHGVHVLNLFGYGIPTSPTRTYIAKEEVKLKVALRNQSYSSLTKLHVANVPILALFKHVTKFALFSGKGDVLKVLAWKAIHCVLKNGMDPDFPMILGILGGLFSKEGKIKSANECSNVVIALAELIRDEDKGKYTESLFAAYGTSFTLLQPFHSSLDPLQQCHKDMKLMGMVEPSLGSMLGYTHAYLAAGAELGPLFESKLAVVEEFCRSKERTSFLTTFRICRQFALNLRKRTETPTELKGEAFNEKETLSKETGPGRAMILRDSSAYRMQLALIFWDEDTMMELLNILADYPLADHLVPRLHNRLCFTGLAAVTLGKSKNSEKIMKLGQQCMSYFENLSKHGSVNARPVYLFMLAMKKPTRESFRKAIDACAESNFIHLEAMVLERYAVYLNTQNDEELASKCLTTAYWRYQDWGANAKALQLANTNDFLKRSTRKSAKSGTMSITSGTTGYSANKDPSNQGNYVYSFNTTLKTKTRIKLPRRK